MSRNTPVIIECNNCGRDVRDGTVGNRLNRRFCDTCRRAYNIAVDDFADYITKMANVSSTQYIRVKEHETLGCYGIREVANELKEKNNGKID